MAVARGRDGDAGIEVEEQVAVDVFDRAAFGPGSSVTMCGTAGA
jgi:hypothetical protein